MAVAFRAASFLEFTNTASPTDVPVPTGTQDGDVLLVWTGTDTNHAISSVTNDFTQLGTSEDALTDSTGSVFWKYASSEPSTWTFTDLFTTSETGVIAVLAYSGADQTTPFSDLGGGSFVSQTNHSNTVNPIPSNTITPSDNDCMIVHLVAGDGAASGPTFTPDTDPAATERVEESNGPGTGVVLAQDYLQGTAAAVSLEMTLSAGEHLADFILAIKPAGGAPPATTFPSWMYQGGWW